MKRLLDNDLIFGRLLTVSEPHLVERYNKALTAFGLKKTKLKSFEIDRTGFSPQVAEELKDDLYLDPNEVNRRFQSSMHEWIHIAPVASFGQGRQPRGEVRRAVARQLIRSLAALPGVEKEKLGTTDGDRVLRGDSGGLQVIRRQCDAQPWRCIRINERLEGIERVHESIAVVLDGQVRVMLLGKVNKTLHRLDELARSCGQFPGLTGRCTALDGHAAPGLAQQLGVFRVASTVHRERK